MKQLSTKPISSPGRMEKFPPPLMRFLRTNAGNRSRGRSKSTSMFLILRKKNTTAINTSIETKEPSSPKVTCMGQVRVKRSSKQPTTQKGISGDGAPTKCRCGWFWWVPHTLFCCKSVKPDSKCCFRFRRNGKASKVSEASMKNGSKESERKKQEHKEDKNRVVNKDKAFVSDCNGFSCSTPPRNDLLLTRCKSAPYSSSSLASRFWGSPLKSEETEQRSEKQSDEKQSDSVSVSKLRFFKELEDSVRERNNESERVCELKRQEEDSVAYPLVLTRCKSERTRKN